MYFIRLLLWEHGEQEIPSQHENLHVFLEEKTFFSVLYYKLYGLFPNKRNTFVGPYI